VVSLALATRAEGDLGASPRSMVALTRCAQARAISEGRDFVLPDDVKALAPAALAHRLIPRQTRGGNGVGRDVVRRILDEVPVPLGILGKG
jgi:MoxR-like ATPase